ncbi:hypothetical protein L7F22_037596 [Adiantum nelumboides]|nr:hypothetical protein [Adiantum nelumboides]
MSNFAEKINEKLHMGGHKKEEEQQQQQQLYGHGDQHGVGMTHAVGEHGAGYGTGYGEHGAPHAQDAGTGVYGCDHGYGEHGVAHPQHAGGVYGVEPGTGAAYGGDKYGVSGHDGHQHALGEHVHGGDQAAGYGAPASAAAAHHEGPVQKVKNKVKAKKEEHDDGSSSSSSETDGEGGRRVSTLPSTLLTRSPFYLKFLSILLSSLLLQKKKLGLF